MCCCFVRLLFCVVVDLCLTVLILFDVVLFVGVLFFVVVVVVVVCSLSSTLYCGDCSV